jgi:peroxidase
MSLNNENQDVYSYIADLLGGEVDIFDQGNWQAHGRASHNSHPSETQGALEVPVPEAVLTSWHLPGPTLEFNGWHFWDNLPNWPHHPWHNGPDHSEPSYYHLEARNSDGSGNHPYNTEWGTAGATLLRYTPANYENGYDSVDTSRANARHISNEVVAQDGEIPNSYGIADIFTYFGQFIDHDIDITPEGEEETLTVTIPDGQILPLTFHRSAHVSGTGADYSTPREHSNMITSFLDASNIYGSSAELTSALRANHGNSAYLLMGGDNGDLLPTLGQLQAIYGSDLPEGIVAGGDNPDLFVAGDVRANENIALTSMHTIWAREHNHQVDRLKEAHPDWTEDQLFEHARVVVEGLYQNIVFNEYLPLLVGADNIPDYWGWNHQANPDIATEFSTAAYRLGHSQISPFLQRSDENGDTADGGNYALRDAFFDPSQFLASGIDPLVRGLASHLGQELDAQIVDEVRNFLFGPPGGPGLDLAALNIMRGRDHGLATLNEFRDYLGMGTYDSFDAINPEIAHKLREAYGVDEHGRDNVDDVDLWVGGLAEENVPGSQLGETFQHIVVDQFVRLRDGDRFFFEERLQDYPELLAEIKQTSFSDIVLRNTDIGYLQDDIFLSHERIGGDDDNNTLKGTKGADLVIGFGGNDRLKGFKGDDDLYGGEGRDRLYGGHGDDIINGGEGNDLLFGGRGSDIFVFDTGSGYDKIKGFEHADKLDLTSYGFDSFDDVWTAASRRGGSTVIELSDTGDKIKLVGVKLWQLDPHNFIVDDDSDAYIG